MLGLFSILGWMQHIISLLLGVFDVIIELFLERFEQKNVNCYANCDENE